MTEIFIALGSNLGDRAANIEAAIARLQPDIEVVQRSPIYESDPKYVTDQPAFLNMVLKARTQLPAAALLARLKGIEADLGRRPTLRYGPRVIDLDIMFYGDDVIESDILAVPHPAIPEREFVLRPLVDIAPQHVHPVAGKTSQELLEALPERGNLRQFRQSKEKSNSERANS